MFVEFLKIYGEIKIVFISTQEKIASHAEELEEIAEYQGIKFYRKANDREGILGILEEIQFLKPADDSAKEVEVLESDPSALRLWELASESDDEDEEAG